jgi:hypothetical protein
LSKSLFIGGGVAKPFAPLVVALQNRLRLWMRSNTRAVGLMAACNLLQSYWLFITTSEMLI